MDNDEQIRNPFDRDWVTFIPMGSILLLIIVKMFFDGWHYDHLPSPPTGAGVYIEGDHVYLDPDQGKEDDDDE